MALTMAKKIDFVDRSAPVEVSSVNHGKRYRNDLLDADNMNIGT